MDRLTNPLVWLRRFRHRCGYGVHSPFAFRFLTEVVYERLPYYAYAELDAHLRWSERWRVRRTLHLLLRIANRVQPSQIVVPTPMPLAEPYLQAGCRRATLGRSARPEGTALFLLAEPTDAVLPHLAPGSVLLLDRLHQHREWFGQLPATVTFDLYDLGIAFFDTRLNRQHYIVNF